MKISIKKSINKERGPMKNIICWRKEFFLVGIIVFLMLMMTSCSSNESNYSLNGDDTNRTEQTEITSAITAITNALNGDDQTITPTKAAMIISNSGPWGKISLYQDGMNEVFGAGQWDQFDIYTETGAAFAPDSPYTFIYLEGSDSTDLQLINYLAAHITEIETWVNNGGRLYINAATRNAILSVNAPFSVLMQANVAYRVNAVDPSHPIFNGPYLPMVTTYDGNAFGFNRIIGTGLTNILVKDGDPTSSFLSSAAHGSGFIIYGGSTFYGVYDDFYSTGNNLYKNILSYAAGI
jgi:hypothetical protein